MIRRVILSFTLRSDWEWIVRRLRPRFATGSSNMNLGLLPPCRFAA